ncbi:MAG: T9SS type A sorting domain-containing protein [Flavitalea sp.]
MNKTATLRGFLLALIALCSVIARSQSLYKVTMEEKIRYSSLIVEGKVLSQTSSWNAKHTIILTTSQVEVYKIFKGDLHKNSIEVTTIGGFIDGHYMEASHQLKLDIDDIGVFFCQPNKLKAFDIYASSQGFLKYDLSSGIASAPFADYKNINRDLYKELKKKAGKLTDIKKIPSPTQLADASEHDYKNATQEVMAPVITSFSPATVTAGTYLDPTNNILTINGTGFGATPGGSAAVLFDDADNAINSTPAVFAYNQPYFLSWTDTEIRMRVPTKAGSGSFSVRDNSGTLAASPSNLTVTYSVFGPYFGAPYNVIKEMNLVDWDGLGGYTIYYSNNTANSGIDLDTHPGKATFQRALTTWKEGAGLNFNEGGAGATQAVGDDGIEMVMFDNAGTGLPPLAAGVLATCYSFAGICTEDVPNNQLVKTGFDIVIRNVGYSSGTTGFTIGPCPPFATSYNAEVDLESVLLHELGHAANLAHIYDPGQSGSDPLDKRNPGKVMHYATNLNFKRTSLDYAAALGAAYSITPQGNTYGACVPPGFAEMTPLATISEPLDECPSSFPVTTTPEFTTIHLDLAHATSNKFIDPSYKQFTTDGTGTGVTNTAYYALRTNNAGALSLEVTGYATTPAAQSACTPFTPSIPVTGVQLSLYQLSSCPGGAAYPTPLAYIIFQADGVLPSVSGLQANTNYLIVVDGVENTKAAFNLTFSGSVLPLKITSFTGKIMPDHNLLWWTADFTGNLKSMELERSADGIRFLSVATISDPDLQKKSSYADQQPLTGNNYYRLAATNADGSTQYSRVILLNRKAEPEINIFPNPAVNTINVEIDHENPGRFTAILYNSLGQVIMEKEFQVNGNSHVEKLPVSGQNKGIYHLSLFNAAHKRVKSATIKLE